MSLHFLYYLIMCIFIPQVICYISSKFSQLSSVDYNYACLQTAGLKDLADECVRQMEEVKSLKDIVRLSTIT